MIQSSVQKASEIREKIKILGNEIDILRNEYVNKDKDLSVRDLNLRYLFVYIYI